MRLLHLLWPHLPLRLTRARWERAHSTPFPRGPIVLGGQPWTSGVVLDRNPAAAEMGIRRGMPLGSAHRLSPEAVFLDPDPAADDRGTRGRRSSGSRPTARGSRRPPIHPMPPSDGSRSTSTACGRSGARSPRWSGGCSWPSPRSCPGPPTAEIAGTHFAATIAAGMRRAGPDRRPCRRRRRVPRTPAGGTAHPRSRRPRPSVALRADPDRRGRGTAALGAGRAVRRGGRADVRPGPWRGDRAVPAAARSRTAAAAAAAGARRRRPRAAAVRPATGWSVRWAPSSPRGAPRRLARCSGSRSTPPSRATGTPRGARARAAAAASRRPRPRRSSACSTPSSSGRRRRHRSRCSTSSSRRGSGGRPAAADVRAPGGALGAARAGSWRGSR